jgi:hypothetical protein
MHGFQAPLVYFFGDVSPDKQADLYKVSLLWWQHWIAQAAHDSRIAAGIFAVAGVQWLLWHPC